MSTTLRDFIANRKGEIREQLKALKAELKELQVAEAALGGQEAATASQANTPTIKDMARTVLGDAADGLTSQEILAAIKARFDREIDRTSLSPQLSRLKEAGEVALSGEKWFSKIHYAAKVSAEYDDYMDSLMGPPEPGEEYQEEDDNGPPF